MGWFSRVKRFRLDVYSSNAKNKLQKLDSDSSPDHFALHVDELVKSGEVNKNWLVFMSWRLSKEYYSMVWRGARLREYRDLIKHGNPTIGLTDKTDFKEGDRSQFMWLSEYMSKAWEYVYMEEPAILIGFNRLDLYEDRTHVTKHVWRRKNHAKDWKDIIQAAIFIRYKLKK